MVQITGDLRMIFLENETDIDLGLDYETIATEVVNKALETENCPYDVEVNILLTDNEGIHEINLSTREIDRPTDVLSFPNLFFEKPGEFAIDDDEYVDYEDPETGLIVLGDIIISLDKVKEQAEEYGHSLKREYAFLIAHSMLHLSGYDHMVPEEAEVMENRQRLILDSIGITRD